MNNDHSDRVLGHASECDGIDEYDNRLPRWWLALLYLTVIWGVGYGVHYHFIGDRSQAGAYEAEMAAAAELWPPPGAEETLALSQANIDAGREIYQSYCSVCHGQSLEGNESNGVGPPNLVDDEWRYGGSVEEILATVTNGTDNGMVPWGDTLGPRKTGQVTVFVYTSASQE